MIYLRVTLVVFKLILLFNYCDILAYNNNDTTYKVTKDVIVTAGRILDVNFEKFNPSFNINDSTLKLLNIDQLGEALSISPGIFIKDYGGAGGLKTISVRGTSAAQSKILINGIELNSTQNGTFDIGLIPESMINSIETIRGGLSVMYGSNAMGGLINIITDNKQGIEAKASYGSYNDISASLSTTLKYSKLKVSTNLDYQNAKGDYTFSVFQFGDQMNIKRTNAQSESISASLNSQYLLKNGDIALFILASSSDRGIPGSVLQGRVENTQANLRDNNILTLLSYNIYNNYFILNNSLSFKTASINFKDPYQIGLNGDILNSDFYSNDIKFTSKMNFTSYVNQNLIFDFAYSNLSGEFLESDEHIVNRANIALAYNLEKTLSILQNDDFAIFSGIRYDYFSDTKSGISPAIGLNYNIDKIHSNIQLNLSYNFRVPGFNEMYYLNYGTKNLIPEKSTTFNLTFNTEIINNLKISASTFLINTDDLIQSIPISPVRWSARNIGKSVNYGLELFSELTLFNNFIHYMFNYTLQKAVDKTEESLFYDKILAYQPLEMLNSYLFFNFSNFNISTNLQYTSYRYSLQSNDINSILDNYLIVNAGLSYLIKLESINLTLQFNVKNIFDTQYQVIKNYPMPGRVYKFSLIYRLS